MYEEIINQSEKSSMSSPYSVTFGNSINRYGDYISNIYIMSVFNGSLTQLVRTLDRIKDVAFHLCHEYSDWEFRVILLRMALIKGNKKEIKGITDLFNDVYGKMNGLDKTSKATLYFNFSMMRLVFNKIDVEEVLSLLSSYTDLEIFEKLEALKTIISIFESGKSELVDDKVLLLILQFTLGSTNDSNHDVRYYATKALIYFLSSDNKEPIMKKFLSIMDYDSVYIKSQIMSNSEKLKDLDEESFAFIKEKALEDNHFVIRERALRL